MKRWFPYPLIGLGLVLLWLLLAESVSTPEQRLTRSTVAELGAALAEAHDGPALILIGPLME